MIDEKYLFNAFNYLHQIPEKSLEEYKTSAFLADELTKLGFNVIRNVNNSTGIIGILDSGKQGKILGLRADIDALGYVIDGKKVYRHSCGHDAHASMVLTAAKAIIEKGIDSGKIYIIFQPAEETAEGAKLMIGSGLLNDMDEIIGMHIRPVEDTGFGKVSPAMYHSSSIHILAKVTGVSSHGARPHLGVNAADAGVMIVNAINTIKGNPYISHSLKVTKIQTGGTSINTIPDEVTIGIDIRSGDNDEMDRLKKLTLQAIEFGAKSVGASHEILEDYGTPAAVYDDEMKEEAKKSIIAVVGEDNLYGDLIIAGGEDFHYYAIDLGCKACYLGLGADATPGLHAPNMTFNHDCIKIGAKVLFDLVNRRMTK